MPPYPSDGESVDADDPVTRYLALGLRLGRHVDGFVDAYYGPPAIADRVAAETLVPPAVLAADAARLVADLDAGAEPTDGSLTPERRHFLRAQVVGAHTSARKLAGDAIAYVDEVERCYDVRPERVPEDVFAAAHVRLDRVLPGSGPVRDRMVAWRDANVVPPERIEGVVDDLAADLRHRTRQAFGLPDGEDIEWEIVTDQPWSGFNYYLGGLRSRVAINVDLPVPAPTIGHLVAHEAYPGHHTEHSRKEVGLVRRAGHGEETIFLVGTPQCVLAEGLADLGLEVVVPEHRYEWLSSILHDHGVDLDPEVAETVSEAGEDLGRVRGNVALELHDRGVSADDAVSYAERWALLPRSRAEKMLAFLTDPTWRAYIHCYVDGLPLCRRFVGGDPNRFDRLLTEQLTPTRLRDDFVAARERS